MKYPVPTNEADRIRGLLDLQILDTSPDPEFEKLISLVQDVFDVPMAAISLVDADRQWFKASIGLNVTETPREIAFCNHTICSEQPFIVPDATKDNEFNHNPLVCGDPHIRSYAGVPLAVETGLNIGTLCVIDTKPREFELADIRRLRRLGDLTQSLLRSHRTALALATKSKALEKQIRFFDRACDLAKMGGFEIAEGTDELIWTNTMFALHEMEPGSLISLRNQLLCYPASDRRRLVTAINEAQRNKTGFTFEGRMYTPKGNMKWVRLICDVEVKDGKEVRRFGMKQDVTQQRNLTEQVRRLAEQDDLTGLLNRRGFRAHLAKRGAREAFPLSSMSFFLFDLDGFKEINDSFGHAAGDACLRRIARRVKIVIKNTGHLARTGGDEFSVIRYGNEDEYTDVGFAQALMDAVRKPIVWRTHTFQISSSVGYTRRAPNQAFSADEVVREADLALYDAKNSGRNCYRPYRLDLGLCVNKRTTSLREARLALIEERFALFYQPKVRLGDNELVGFECLLRMHTMDDKLLLPGSFQAALDDIALSQDIGDFVIRSALDQAAEWQCKNVHFGSVAINLSASQFRDAEFAHTLLKDIETRGLPLSTVEIEVTESIFLSTAGGRILSACKTLSEAGVRIAFDDFGTGFASLTHLRDFPVDVLKIDRSFISELSKGKNATAIVNAMVGLGINLGMEVVAEGVETEAQAAFLRAIGCQTAQGYLFSRPLPAGLAKQYAMNSREMKILDCGAA